MSPKPISRRHILAGAAVVVPAGAISLLTSTEAHAQGQSRPSRAQSVVARYFDILNAGMASANADFSALATVYASDAVLTQSSPAGVTNVYRGLAAVTGFYVAAWQNFHGLRWTQDQVRSLASSVVLSYEHAARPGQTKPGPCAHLFMVHRGLISTLDWVTYYPGVP
jgi:SnoaL-like domain